MTNALVTIGRLSERMRGIQADLEKIESILPQMVSRRTFYWSVGLLLSLQMATLGALLNIATQLK